MRVLLQRVARASVAVDGVEVGSIDGPGLLALVAVTHTDTDADARRLADKSYDVRIFDDERSAAELGAPVLVVSQFTLYADTRRGRRPTWSAAAPAEVARPLVDQYAAALVRRGARVATGVFGADMAVTLVNDGPVTLLLET